MRVEDITILIGENSVLARKQLKDALISLGAKHILDASDGQEVIDMYKEHIPDLVFLTLLMPGKDGNAAISEIKADYPDADIVVVSSMGTQTQIKQMLQFGVTDFIQKPFENDQIEAIINARVEGRA